MAKVRKPARTVRAHHTTAKKPASATSPSVPAAAKSSPTSLEVALRESEDRYRQLVELLPNPLVVHIAEKLAYVNPAAITLFGAQSAEELIGKPIWEIILPEYHERIQQRLKQIRTEGRAAQFFECKFRRMDGQIIDVEVAGAAMTYGGQPAIQTVIRDLTERKRTDQALRASEERYRNLFENANDAIAAFTVDGTLTDVNRGAEVLLGWSREELIGQPYHKVLTQATQVTAEERTRRYLAGEDMPSIFEIEFVRKDGTIVPVEARTRPIRDRTGKTVGFQGTYRDITARRQMEAALQENRRLLERIADTMPDIVYLYQYPTHQTVYVNRQLTQVLGYAPEQLQGQPGPFQTLLHPQDTTAFANQQQQVATAADGERIEAIYRVRHANGSYRWLQSRETVFRRTEEGQPAQIFGAALDITGRQRIMELTQEQRLRLEALPERLREFRERLGLTQSAFGSDFGGYSARQITSYERGQIEIPLKLLLAIHTKGYPLAAVFGTDTGGLVEETVEYLTMSYPERTFAVELATALLRLLAHDRTTIERVLRELEIPAKGLSTEQKRLLDHLASLTKAINNPPH